MRVAVVTIGVGLGFLIGAIPPAQAENQNVICPICHRANNQQAPYAEKAGMTLARGVVNTAFGWTELLVQPTAEVNAGGNVVFGIGKGVGYAVKRTALGLGELLTFWTPKNKDGSYLTLTTDCPICFPAGKRSPAPIAPSTASPVPAPPKRRDTRPSAPASPKGGPSTQP